MSDRYILLTASLPNAETAAVTAMLTDLVADLRLANLTWTHPTHRTVTRLTTAGDAVVTDLPELARLVGLEGVATFQVWFGAGADVVCEVRVDEPRGLWTERYYFARPDDDETRRLVAAFARRVRRMRSAGVLQLGVVDLEGTTAEHNWPAVAASQRPVQIPPGATFVVIPADRAVVDHVPPGYDAHETGPLRAFAARATAMRWRQALDDVRGAD